MTASAAIGDKFISNIQNPQSPMKPRKRTSGAVAAYGQSCEREVAQIAKYVAGALPVQRTSKFEQHLDACADCMAFLATYKKTIELTRAYLQHAVDAPSPLPPRPRKHLLS